jgi:hypothetical protein
MAPAKSRQQLETDLLEILRQRRLEWIDASEDSRVEARGEFMDALSAFNRLVLNGKISDDYVS